MQNSKSVFVVNFVHISHVLTLNKQIIVEIRGGTTAKGSCQLINFYYPWNQQGEIEFYICLIQKSKSGDDPYEAHDETENVRKLWKVFYKK